MKKISFLAIAAMVVIGVAFASCDTTKTVNVKSEIDSVSYIIGASYGFGLRQQASQFPGASENPINMDALIKGFVDAAKGDSVFLGMEMNEAGSFVNSYFQNAQMKATEASNAENNKFLAENAKQSGVITTESGLQYKVITEGTGPKPKETDKIKVNYRGNLLNGEEFDSSEKHGGPAEFILGNVITGWIEGLQLMPVGSKYVFWIPSNLAYDPAGPQGSPYYGKLLIFEIELLEILKQ